MIRYLLLVSMSFALVNHSMGQCVLKWRSGKSERVSDRLIIVDSLSYPIRLLDSIIDDIKTHPRKPRFSSDASDFKIYRYQNRDLVHYNTHKYKVGNDSIAVHTFSFGMRSTNGDWNEDAAFNFLYVASLGIIDKYESSLENPKMDIWLADNSCLNQEKKEQLKALIGVMIRSGEY